MVFWVAFKLKLFDILFSIDIVSVKRFLLFIFTETTMSIEHKKASGSSFSLY